MRCVLQFLTLFSGCVLCAAPPQASAEHALREEMLAAHNKVRAQVGVPALTWSDSLAAVAQQWAESLLKSGKFTHRPQNKFGENLFEARGSQASPAEVVGVWTAEAKNYDPKKNACRQGTVCGHYTQLVWRRTNQVGCGVARGGGREVWVCNYDPPGNFVGERPF